MNTHTIPFAGHAVELCGDKLVWIPALKLLCASDIHFEKGSFFRRFGTLLPPYDTQETLHGLQQAVAHFKPDIFIALGDSFHDVSAWERLSPEITAQLSALIYSVPRWVWITGNHDPDIGKSIPGQRHEELHCGGIHFRHELLASDAEPEISGHYHPKAKIVIRGTRIASACFARNANKLIMPAFGSYTGGLYVDDDALLAVMPREGRDIYLAYQGGLYPL